MVVIGAGPAGLTAAYEMAKAGDDVVVFEGDSVVGGISRTVLRDGWRFDIGGHRFFTKVEPVEAFWHEILPNEDFLLRPRMSRIYYEGKFYDYPLKPANALRNLGPLEAFLCGLSYIWARIAPPKNQDNYEGWLVARFGWRLYRTFFKTYTEKVWGVPVDKMPADWAAQRVKNLDLRRAILNAVLPKRNQKDITSLIEEFQYPKYGPGMMWERCAELASSLGVKVVMNAKVTRVHLDDDRAVGVTIERSDGSTEYVGASHVISTMPLRSLTRSLEPEVPSDVLRAANDLHYRDFLTVALVMPKEKGFPDNWIYIHSTEVKVGRVQNFGAWSPYMIKDQKTCLGLEYFVFEGDELWESSDEALIARAEAELIKLGLASVGDVEAGYVVRVPKAYPYYDFEYRDNVQTIRNFLEAHAVNVYPIGRNGMHKYNNQDHSMYTAMLTVENIHGASHDIWAVNVEEEYHESSTAPSSERSGGTGRDAPVLPRMEH
ncbi:MAG: NAD(P)/FAD-dependent oxidoreductase [Actinobacteria bacterium]|nr:NAD(P)/FAD-dependent oxidoreductase [Actinomycetota bacterium]